MKQYLPAILLIFLCSSSGMAQEMDSAALFHTLFKCWRSVSHEYSPVYGLEEEEITTYAKQKVCLGHDSVVMYSGPLYAPQYSVKKVGADNYAKDNFDCDKVKLGIIRDSVYEIDISSQSRSMKDGKVHKMTDMIAFDGNYIYVVKDGVIFKLYDSEVNTSPRGSN